jgi:hypothetical protein
MVCETGRFIDLRARHYSNGGATRASTQMRLKPPAGTDLWEKIVAFEGDATPKGSATHTVAATGARYF